MRAFVEEALYRCFGMRVKAMWEAPGGWSAHALVADTDAGQYFVRVRATNSDGYTQDAFDYYVTDDGKH